MSALHENRGQAEATADKLKTFAQPQRLMVLSLLLDRGEQSVSEIGLATGIGQPALSQQLGELRRAGLVSTRRQSKQVHYSLADDATQYYVRNIEAVFGTTSPEMPTSLQGRSSARGSEEIAPGAASFVRLLVG